MSQLPLSYEQVASYFWWHTIELGNGLVTPGEKPREVMDAEFALTFDGLDLRGKTVLDVGAWNGAFSIEAKRRGATRVVALDHATWNSPEFRGRETFDLAVKACGVEIEAFDQDLDVPQLSLADLLSFAKVPAFDIVLYLGVFYHLKNPLAATRELAAITRETMVLETVLDAPSETRPGMIFYPGDELDGDPTNWWGPNRRCVEALLELYGFKQIAFAMNGKARGSFHAHKQLLHGKSLRGQQRGGRARSNRQGSRAAKGMSMLRSDVIDAYRAILRREPESEEVIRDKMSEASRLEHLYRNLIASDEFREISKHSLDSSGSSNPGQPRKD